MSAESVYVARDACRLAGCAYRTLDFWCRSGVLQPSVQPASGKGSDRLFSATDVRCLVLIRLLRALGVELAVTVRFADYLRTHPDLTGTDVLLLRDGAVTDRHYAGIVAADLAGGLTLIVGVPELPIGEDAAVT